MKIRNVKFTHENTTPRGKWTVQWLDVNGNSRQLPGLTILEAERVAETLYFIGIYSTQITMWPSQIMLEEEPR